MKKNQIEAFLKALGTKPTSFSSKWVSAHCPLAPWTHDSGKDSNPSFAISCNSTGESMFNCFACHKGDLLYLVQLLKQYGAGKPKYNIKQALEILADEEEDKTLPDIKDFDEYALETNLIVPWDEEWLGTFFKAVNVPIAMEYLNGRCVAKEIAAHLDIRWDGSRECVSFPVRDFEARLVGMRGRRLGGGYYDYAGPQNHRNKLVWYGEENLDPAKTVVMVESVFDYASVVRVFENLTAPLTVGMSKAKVQRMECCLDIVTLFDNGAGGNKARALIDKYLSSAIRVHCYPPKHRGDPGEMTVEEVCNVLKDKVKLKEFSFSQKF